MRGPREMNIYQVQSQMDRRSPLDVVFEQLLLSQQ